MIHGDTSLTLYLLSTTSLQYKQTAVKSRFVLYENEYETRSFFPSLL